MAGQKQHQEKGPKSQHSIPYHIAHIARLNDDRKRYFENPIKEKLSKESALKYIHALESLLKTPGASSCESENVSVQAWINHGEKRKGHRFAFSNSDLNGYESLLSSAEM